LPIADCRLKSSSIRLIISDVCRSLATKAPYQFKSAIDNRQSAITWRGAGVAELAALEML
jgi:hypothetical protein